MIFQKIVVNFFTVYILPFLFFNQCFSQKDYVVKNGDTIYGILEKPTIGKMRLTNDDGVFKISPDSFSLYCYQYGPTFCSKPKNEKGSLVFMQRIYNGKINLYRYTFTSSTGTVDSWYAEKDSFGCKEIVNNSLLDAFGRGGRNFFRSLIADNPMVLKEFDKKGYNRDNIEQAVSRYNAEAKKKD